MKSLTRCPWVKCDKPYYVTYHDEEWGVAVHDEDRHLEMLILEGAQAGLSWEIVLKKRVGYRVAFHRFNPEKVAAMPDSELEQCLNNPAIIRNRLKIFSARDNAQVFLKLKREFGSFDHYIWGFINHQPIVHQAKTMAEVPSRTIESDKIAADLKKRGMRFVGTTIIYAYMQAIGMTNDHLVGCFRYTACLPK